jgi:hypothetical protein
MLNMRGVGCDQLLQDCVLVGDYQVGAWEISFSIILTSSWTPINSQTTKIQEYFTPLIKPLHHTNPFSQLRPCPPPTLNGPSTNVSP